MDIFPDEVYACIFAVVDKIEYQALTCTNKRLQSISSYTSKLFTHDFDSVTCFVKNYHLTSYQTYVLRVLLFKWPFYSIPDLYNLRRIAAAYASVTGHDLLNAQYIKQALIAYPELLDSLSFAESTPRLGTDHEICVGNVTLRLGYDSHPLYAAQQRYPVWVSNRPCTSINELPEGRVLYLTCYDKNKQHEEETQLHYSSPIECYYQAYDIFYTDTLHVYNVFSTLTQLRSSKPKLLVINGPCNSNSYIPLPAKHINSGLEQLQCINARLMQEPIRICYTPLNPTPAKLFLLGYFDCYSNDETERSLIQTTINEWIGNDSVEVLSNTVSAKRSVTIEYMHDSRLTHRPQIPTKGPVKIKTELSVKDKWILIDPCAELHTQLQTSIDTGKPRSETTIDNTNLRHSLEYILANPTARKDALSKNELMILCKNRGVTYLNKDTRIQLVNKLLAKL